MRALPVCLALGLVGCGLGGGDGITIRGRVTGADAVARRASADAPRVVTHVMAVNPETSAPRRSLAAVDANGEFALSVEPGSPYVLVFVDSTAVGVDMAVAIFRAQTLDTLAPQLAADLELGEVAVDPATQTATASVPYDALLASLGLSAAAAEFLGAVDDLSLRYANPDIDGDGVIDLVQEHSYALDVHVRATTRRGAGGPAVIVDDLTDAFLDGDGPEVATPVFDLTSMYVLYPASLDATTYTAMGMPAAAPVNGGVFTTVIADGSAAPVPSSFSGLGFGDTRAWGPDYDFTHSASLELPGSGGSPATLAYTLGAIGTTLTFANVVTHTRAELAGDGTLMIFLKLVTAGGSYASIEYQWRKRVGAAWIAATAEEIALTIGGEGGHVSFHRAPSWSHEFGAQIPAQPSGTIAWTFEATGPDDVCGLAVSYDDKLGLRHFVGGASPNPGVSCAP